MSKTNLLSDLSILSGVAVTNLEKLSLLSGDIISHAVFEAKLNHEPVAEIDIGIGLLYILISEEELKYKFIPSSTTQFAVKQTLAKNRSRLIDKVDSTLSRRIMNTYKDLF